MAIEWPFLAIDWFVFRLTGSDPIEFLFRICCGGGVFLVLLWIGIRLFIIGERFENKALSALLFPFTLLSIGLLNLTNHGLANCIDKVGYINAPGSVTASESSSDRIVTQEFRAGEATKDQADENWRGH